MSLDVDPPRSRAVLLGVSFFPRDPERLPPLPAVRNNLRDLERALADPATLGLDARHITVVDDRPSSEMLSKLVEVADEAEDSLIVYYAGHGVPGSTNLYLTGTDSSERTIEFDGMPFDQLRRALSTSPARKKVLILDCCYSGRAIDVMGTADAMLQAGIEELEGTYTLVSSGATEASAAPAGERHTAFTGELLRVLQDGVADAPQTLKLSEIFRALRLALRRNPKFPEPRQAAKGTAGDIDFVHNRAWRPQTVASEPKPTPADVGATTAPEVLKRPDFERLGRSPPAAGDPRSAGWEVFEPNHLHCAVVVSEFSERQNEQWGVANLMEEALVGKLGGRVWQSFRSHWNDVDLLSANRRSLAPTFDRNAVHVAPRAVTKIYASDSELDEAIRLIAEADVAVFDVTHFEPGVMLLLGIRAASRRGVTICSHGDGWQEGEPLTNTPFNLRDLNFNSHTKAAHYVGENPVVERFVRRVEEGFSQLSRQPGYLDLPVFDSLRRLGSGYEARSTIDIHDEILVLCSYGSGFFPKWEYIRAKLNTALSQSGRSPEGKFPEIRRLVDIATPQLVSQYLYERVRRLAGCLMDWTDFSPSAFLELGVRLAVSAWGVVQLIEESYVPGNANAARLADRGRDAPELTQAKHMRDRFSPISYRYDTEDRGGTVFKAFDRVVERLLEQRERGEVDSDDNRIHRIVADAVSRVQAASLPVDTELVQAAEALHQNKQNSPQVLFHRTGCVKLDAERAALERRLAAWFYLKNRIRAQELDQDDPRRTLYEEVGREAAVGLYSIGGEQDVELAIQIEEQLGR